jgi:hypothetical protein
MIVGAATQARVRSFHVEARKSRRLMANPKRGIGFEVAQDIFMHPYYLAQPCQTAIADAEVRFPRHQLTRSSCTYLHS